MSGCVRSAKQKTNNYKYETQGSLKTFDQCEILRHLSYVCLSVRPSVRSNHDCVRKSYETSNFANRLLLAIGRSVLKMGYSGPQDLVPPI